MKRFPVALALLVLLLPQNSLAFDPNYILSDEELTDSFAMDINGIQAFLDRGYLGDYKTEDHEGRTRYAADIIWRAAQTHGINPKFLLVLLQKEQSLVEDPDPTQKQLDWATGYAVCDDCSMNDPYVMRWQGFGKQINSAALQFIEGYMADIENYGETSGKYGPGITVVIDGERVTPANAATAAMYAYTPHLHGNDNFVAIWNRWFGREYPSGTLVQVPGEDGVWLIQHGTRRPILSASALHSRFNSDLIVSISKSNLDSLPTGTSITLPNYTLVKDEDGGIYLLVDDALRHIESMEAFRSIGFSEDEIIDISNNERKAYEIGDAITTITQFPQGQLLQLKTNGAVFYIQDGKRHPILDRSVLKLRFPDAALTPADPVEIEQFREGKALGLPDGALARTTDNPAVYVISEGERRLIPSESVFTAYGYDWADIVVVPESVMRLHPEGDVLEEEIVGENND